MGKTMRIFKMAQSDEPRLMKAVCAWCGKLVDMLPSKNPGTTHVICEKCSKEIEAEI